MRDERRERESIAFKLLLCVQLGMRLFVCLFRSFLTIASFLLLAKLVVVGQPTFAHLSQMLASRPTTNTTSNANQKPATNLHH